jgi:thioredoxin 1
MTNEKQPGPPKSGAGTGAVVVLGGLLIVVLAIMFSRWSHGVSRPGGEDNTSRSSETSAQAVEPGDGIPTLLDLGSVGCIPCKMMAPELEALKEEYEGKLEVVVVDVRQDPSAGPRYGIRAIPTQIFFDASGKELYCHVGYMSKQDILAKWRELGFDLR